MEYYQHILVSVDDSPIAVAAADQAMILAKAFGSKVTIVSVVIIDPLTSVSFYKNVPGVTDYFMEAKAHAKNILAELGLKFTNGGIETHTQLLAKQSPSDAIAELADELKADLIVVGSHGRTGLKKTFIGSIAQDILTASHVPVLVVKHTQ